jgi:hypothetical protein
LVVGGDFALAGSVAGTKSVAVWNGNQWSALGGGTDGSVRSIAQKDEDTLVVGGLFDYALDEAGNEVPGTARIAKWSNAEGWTPLGLGLGETWPDLVRSIAVDSERDLIYAGGDFRKYVGGANNSLNGIGVWDEGVSEWIPLRYSSTSNGLQSHFVDVMAIVVDGAHVYLGGDFADAGGIAAADRVAMWTWDPPQGSNVVGSLPATLSGEGFIGVPATGGVKFGSALATYTRVNSNTITVTSFTEPVWGGSSISVNGVGGWGIVGTCVQPVCPNAPAVVPEPNVIQSLPTLPESTPLAGATGTTMSQGESISVTYGGFTPSETVHLWVNSAPQLIGSGNADSTGTVTISGSIPPGLAAGPHTLVLYAPVSNTGVRQPISVVSTTLPSTTLPSTTLPSTGSKSPLIPLAMSLLVVGVISRRLRRNT